MCSFTIAALIALGASALQEALPSIQEGISNALPGIERAASDFLRQSAKNGTLKMVLKSTDWRKVGETVSTGIKNAAQDTKQLTTDIIDDIKYNDDQGGWTKR